MKNLFCLLFILICNYGISQFQLQGVNLGETTTQMNAISIGNVTSNGAIQSRLHVNNFGCFDPSSATFNGKLFRTDGDRKVVNQWSMWSGENATGQTEKFRLYIDAETDEPFMGIRSLTNGIRFETEVSDVRMRINGAQNNTINGFNVNTSGFVAITRDQGFLTNGAQSPYSLLHIAGEAATTQQSGYRPWMKDGITFTANSDLGFIGPRAIQNDITEFVLAVTDNANADGYGPDDFVVRFLRFNGDGGGSNPLTNSMEGLEIMRCAAGLSGKGVVGIGDEFSHLANARPERRLHVHDPGPNNSANAQLRLSQSLVSKFTDFRVTTIGDLFIDMNDSIGVFRNVGIEESAPIERLDVNGNGRFQNIPDGGFDCIIVGRNVNAPEDNSLRRLDLTGDSNTYLAGDGTWATIPSNPICDWNLQTNGTSNDLVMGYAGACNEGNVGIGVDNPAAKLDVWKSTPGVTANQTGAKIELVGGLFANTGLDVAMSSPVFSGATETIGIRSRSQGGLSKNFGGYFEALSVNGSNMSTGLFAQANGPDNSIGQIGVSGFANFGYNSIGVYGRATTNLNGAPITSRNSTGVYGYADAAGSAPVNFSLIGVHGRANAANYCGYRAIGVYGALQNVDTTCNPNSWAGYFSGDVFTTGIYQSSDEALKTNIEELNNPTELLMALQPKSYNYNTEQFPSMNLPGGSHMGFLAQEIAEIMPGLVRSNATIPVLDSLGNVVEDEVPFLCVNYTELIPLVVAVCKEQQVAISNLTNQLSNLQEQLNACCTADQAMQGFPHHDLQLLKSHEAEITLKNPASIILDQNIPNPMEETTIIPYRIDENFTQAEIIFYNAEGRRINAHQITSTGEGQLTVFADDLSSGIYTYVLVVDGKVIDTKKMVKK
jgi:hypothetical protein